MTMSGKQQSDVRKQSKKLNNRVLKVHVILQKATSKRQLCKSTLTRCQSCYFMRTCVSQNQKRKYGSGLHPFYQTTVQGKSPNLDCTPSTRPRVKANLQI